MKKMNSLRTILWSAPVLILMISAQTLTDQEGPDKSTKIPDDINKIFQTSCLPCHGEKGGRMPTSKLAFFKWGEYDAATRSEKALSICSTVTKGTMPPKNIRDTKPELVLTKEQVDQVCKWAESLKPVKKE